MKFTDKEQIAIEEMVEKFILALRKTTGLTAAPSESVRPILYQATCLARAAFQLYVIEWDCHPYSHPIDQWKWPFFQLESSKPFGESNEPWTVLLRQAYRLTHLRLGGSETRG